MTTETDVRDWLEGLRAKNLGPSGDHAIWLLDALDRLAGFERHGFDGQPNEEIDTYEKIVVLLKATGLVDDQTEPKNYPAILAMFLPGG